jgi:predicted transcriptional regulator
METNDDTVQISARVPATLAADLEKAAMESDRTVSAELRRAIRQYLAPPSAQTNESRAA